VHGSDIYTEVSSTILDTTSLQVLLQKDLVPSAAHGLSACPAKICGIFLGNSVTHLGWNRPQEVIYTNAMLKYWVTSKFIFQEQ